MAFKRAVKLDAKLRLAISGPAGSGKTFTLLRLATELARDSGGKVAYVDTEHGSASKYAHTPACAADCKDPSHFNFDVIEPSAFDPRNLMESIDDAIQGGYSVFCCDSLSHYWMGPDGELEMVDNAAKQSRSGNSFAAWKTVTPIHNSLVDKMLSAPIHILVSMRTKTEWVIEKDEKGKQVPRKIGLAPVMRDGIEFEFDVCGDIDQDNTLTVTKSRCSALAGKSINRPGRDMAEILKIWLGSSPVPEPGARKDQTGNTATQEPAGTHVADPSAAVPEALQAVFAGLSKSGGASQALTQMKRLLEQAMPQYGDTEYRRIVDKHGLRNGGMKIGAIKAALLEMWTLAEFAKSQAAEREPFVASDDDLPSGLFDQSTKDQEAAHGD